MSAFDDKVLDALMKGREYFATHEWNRDGQYFAGGLRNPDVGTCCGVGAVYAAAGFNDEFDFVRETGIVASDIADALYEVLTPEQKDAADGRFYEFNDRVAESKDEVLAVFDRAIEARRAAVTP